MDGGRTLDTVTDGGTRQRHHECRGCGTNREGDATQCPDCGSAAAVYESWLRASRRATNSAYTPADPIRRHMPITDGDSVTIEYVGRLTDGTVFDTSDEGLAEAEGLTEDHPGQEFEPLTIEMGSGSVIPGIEDALAGMEVGDSEIIRVPPEKAYGEYREDRVGEYDRDEFDKMLRSQELREGIEVQTEAGLPGVVVDVGPETVTVDFNHDLAGETLEFEIKVVDVS